MGSRSQVPFVASFAIAHPVGTKDRYSAFRRQVNPTATGKKDSRGGAEDAEK